MAAIGSHAGQLIPSDLSLQPQVGQLHADVAGKSTAGVNISAVQPTGGSSATPAALPPVAKQSDPNIQSEAEIASNVSFRSLHPKHTPGLYVKTKKY